MTRSVVISSLVLPYNDQTMYNENLNKRQRDKSLTKYKPSSEIYYVNMVPS